ncbi:G-protein coupled receptor 4-like [Epinephelus lanceolatus]
MEDLHINNTSQDNSDYYSNIIFDHFNFSDFHDYFSDYYSDLYDYYSDLYDYYSDFYDYYSVFPSFDTFGHAAEAEFIINVVTCVILSIGLPLTLMAIYALYSQVRNDHVAPIYIINLLISDIIQFCCMIVAVAKPEKGVIDIFKNLHRYCLGASVGFMVCVALERYLVIACPLWYRFRRTIEISVLVCVVVWLLPALCFLTVSFCSDDRIRDITFAIFRLLPLPLLTFFLGGTLRALSASNSVPSDEKRRIVGMLVLVLLIYMLLFLPSIIWSLAQKQVNSILYILLHVFRRLSPLADLVLYVFMRKGAIDRVLAAVCCCRMDSNETRSMAVSVVTTHPQSASSRQRQRDTETEIEEGTEDM